MIDYKCNRFACQLAGFHIKPCKPPDQTISRTSNPYCPACNDERQHTDDEWTTYHPLAGTGTSKY